MKLTNRKMSCNAIALYYCFHEYYKSNHETIKPKNAYKLLGLNRKKGAKAIQELFNNDLIQEIRVSNSGKCFINFKYIIC